MAETYEGPIDSFSPYSLYDILENDFRPWEDDFHFEYYGFHIIPQHSGKYHVQYDGHAGSVMEFHRDDYDDVLELVADLNTLLIRAQDFNYRDDKEGLVEWAGKIMTSDQTKVDEKPELYMKAPEGPPEVDFDV